ncbi:hypothetical protein A2U01_0061191, partial [Trifolium medium]|nr:hypothetical protein [Trifolium medium]
AETPGKDYPKGFNHRVHHNNGRNGGEVVRSVSRHSSHHRRRIYILKGRGLATRDGREGGGWWPAGEGDEGKGGGGCKQNPSREEACLSY